MCEVILVFPVDTRVRGAGVVTLVHKFLARARARNSRVSGENLAWLGHDAGALSGWVSRRIISQLVAATLAFSSFQNPAPLTHGRPRKQGHHWHRIKAQETAQTLATGHQPHLDQYKLNTSVNNL